MWAFTLLLLAVSPAWSQVFPRQTTLSNATTSSSTSTTSTTSPGPPPGVTAPPCCWVIGGTFAVGLNRWWTSSVEETVATVITNYAVFPDNSTHSLNETTIYAPANATFPASSYGGYQASQLYQFPITSPISIPKDLLTGSWAPFTLVDDYAGSFIDNTTVATFANTDLQITSPTPYDYWMNFGILTFYPSLNYTPSPFTAYDSGMCGYWSSDTVLLYSTGPPTTYTTTRPVTYDWTTSSSTSTLIQTYTESIYTVGTSTEPATFVPAGVQVSPFFEGPPFPGLAFGQTLAPNITGYDAVNLEVTYVTPVTSQLPDGNVWASLPSGLLPWLASNATISSKYPFIANCWTLPGVGQPTVHAPVTQLTKQSSNFVTMAGPTPAKTTSLPTAQPVTQSNGNTPSPGGNSPGTSAGPSQGNGSPTTGGRSQPDTHNNASTQGNESPTQGNTQPAQDNGSPSQGNNAPTQNNTPPTEGNNQPTQGGSQPTQANNAPTQGGGNTGEGGSAQSPANTQGNNSPAAPTQGTSTTDNDIVNLLGAISSVAQQTENVGTGAAQGTEGNGAQSAQPTNAAGVFSQALASDQSGQSPAAGESAAGAASPVVTDGRTVYPGSPTVINGQTVSVSGTRLVQANPASPVVTDGQTVYAGAPTVINGQTVSVSGTQIVQVAPAGLPVVTDGQTVYPGTPTVMNGQTVSVSGTQIVQVAPAASPIVTVGQTVYPGTPTVVDGETVIASGTQIVPAVAAVISGYTVYSGVPTVINGQTVSVSGSQLVPASNISPVVFAGQTVYAGSATVINGETVSISGTELVIASGTVTTTQGLGDAILSGLGETGGSDASITPAAYTGAGMRHTQQKAVVLIAASIILLVLM